MGLASDGQDVYFSIGVGGGADTNLSTIPIQGGSHQDVLSESVVRVSLNDSGVQLVDFFRPFDYLLDAGQDIGSGGVSILDEAIFKTSSTARISVATSCNAKMYVQNLDDLGGYRTSANGTDAVLQTIHLNGEVFGGIGSYPLEGGYIYVKPCNGSLAAYRFNPSASKSSLFTLAGTSSAPDPHCSSVGIPTVTSRKGEPGSGIVWVTDVERGLLAYRAVPVNGSLVELGLPRVEGAVRSGRPVFGDGRVYVVDSKERLVALGVAGNGTVSGG